MDRDIADILDIVNLANPPRVRNRRRRRRRLDPFRLPDREFKQRYRFSKEGVRRMVETLRPFFGGLPVNQRGRPFDAEHIVCSGLDLLGGGHFQRVEGVCANSCITSAHKNLYRYITILIFLPVQLQLQLYFPVGNERHTIYLS